MLLYEQTEALVRYQRLVEALQRRAAAAGQ
jgi:hypothetical protein